MTWRVRKQLWIEEAAILIDKTIRWLDPGISQMVRILNAKGLTTTRSCAGHFDSPRMGFDAYIVLDEKAFNIYIALNRIKMESFLLQGGPCSWVLDIRNSAKSRSDTKIIAIEPRIVLPFSVLLEYPSAQRARIKKGTLHRIEEAAERFL